LVRFSRIISTPEACKRVSSLACRPIFLNRLSWESLAPKGGEHFFLLVQFRTSDAWKIYHFGFTSKAGSRHGSAYSILIEMTGSESISVLNKRKPFAFEFFTVNFMFLNSFFKLETSYSSFAHLIHVIGQSFFSFAHIVLFFDIWWHGSYPIF